MLGALAFAALLQVPGPPGESVPGTRYDPSILTLESVVGHHVSEVVTPPDQVVRYFEALAEAAPDRTQLIRYAESWEGRPLVVLVVGSPERMARLEDVKAALRQRAYPDGLSNTEVDQLIADLPVVTALMHGVHGNEISSSGAAIVEAYHLLAAQNDPNVDLIFQESIVLIDLVENPDGHRFARNLLDDHVPMAEEFVQRQVERRARREPDEIYDLTAWSQSLLWDVEVIPSDRATGASGAALEAEAQPNPLALPAATVGYLLPWGTAAAGTVVEALQAGIRVRAAGAEFTLGGREYAVGTAIVRVAENDSELRGVLGRIAARHGAEVVPIDDSYVSEGMSLGARSVRALRTPNVLLVYDGPGQSSSVGWARYVLERRYGQPTTAVRASSLGRANLSDYDVVIFPSGNYGGTVGSGLVDDLRAWMSDGGTLITMAESTGGSPRAPFNDGGATGRSRGGRGPGQPWHAGAAH